MIIDKVGRYVTNREYKGGNSISVWSIPSGSEFTVTQINKEYHQFISDIFGDWSYWDKDVAFVKDL